jgi:choice-of-anchor C domain-containing protein
MTPHRLTNDVQKTERAMTRRGGTRLTAALVTMAAVAQVATLDAAPSAPGNLAAVVTGTTVALTWTPSAVGPVIGYRLEAGSASGLSNLASVVLATTPSFTATAVPTGTYFVRVRAIGFDGESEPSNEVLVTVAASGCLSPPNSPTNLASTIGGLTVSLTWLPGGGCPATNFTVQVGSAPGLSNLAIVNMGLGTGLSALALPGIYYVRVVAQNGFGTSLPSNEAIVVVPGGAPPSPPVNLLINGSFETGPTILSGTYRTLGSGSTSIAGWVVTGSSIDYINQTYRPPDGIRSVDLDGAFSTGGIRQTFATTPGAQYTVTFYLSGSYGYPPPVKGVRVTVAGFVQDYAIPTQPTLADLRWEPFSFVFTATSSSSTLTFTSLSPSGNSWGAFLDHVSVYPR